ncbi:hypothetical protein L195_g031360 [Trifolium pratense]|uniref:Uncharacterized protein n=1 Tax=Trifolium pratense TaxID=57577 RepID=A0A2K3LA77_TRIPR|nr:hypothetical protein L195_g031360 [Trifolium pratense]
MGKSGARSGMGTLGAGVKSCGLTLLLYVMPYRLKVGGISTDDDMSRTSGDTNDRGVDSTYSK